MFLHLDLLCFWQVMQVPDEGSQCSMHFIIIGKAKLKEFQTIKNYRTFRYLSPFFLQNAAVNVIDVKVKPWVIAIPFKSAEVEGAVAELRRAFFQSPRIWGGFVGSRVPLLQQLWGGV